MAASSLRVPAGCEWVAHIFKDTTRRLRHAKIVPRRRRQTTESYHSFTSRRRQGNPLTTSPPQMKCVRVQLRSRLGKAHVLQLHDEPSYAARRRETAAWSTLKHPRPR